MEQIFGLPNRPQLLGQWLISKLDEVWSILGYTPIPEETENPPLAENRNFNSEEEDNYPL